MGQGCTSGVDEINTYKIDRNRGGPGFIIYQESTMIVAVTDQRLVSAGLQPGSILTHVNDEEVHNVSDYQRLANPARGPRFRIKVQPPAETNTLLVERQSNNIRYVVGADLIVSHSNSPQIVNRKVEKVNGVALNDDFKRFHDMTSGSGKYFLTLSNRIPIPTEYLCNAISIFKDNLNAKTTEEVKARIKNLIRWQRLVSSISESHLEHGVTNAEHVVNAD